MFKKKVSYLILAVIMAAQANLFVPNTFGATTAELKTQDANSVTLVKGCPGTINVELNTGGESVLAGDSKFSLTGDAVIDSVSIGSILPMQTYNQVSGKDIKLSGARFPNSGGFNGNGVYGTIHLTPSTSANSVSVAFSSDITLDNNMVNGDIENVLKSVTGGTYTVRDKYNNNINGGYCNPDVTAPVFTMTDPLPNSKNNPADTNMTFTVSDDRSGVNIGTLQLTINGSAPTNPIITQSGGVYQITVNPDSDFALGSQVDVNVVKVCDNDGNCLNNQTQSFRIVPPASCGDSAIDPGEECDNGASNGNMNECTSSCTKAKCGDGYIWWGKEDCDDGNLEGGDGCTALCKLEPGGIKTITTECPTTTTTTTTTTEQQTEEQQATTEQPGECPTCPVCEEKVKIEYIQPEEVSQQEQNTAMQTATTASSETQTATKPEYVVNTENKCDAYVFGTDSDKDGLADKMECYLGTDMDNGDTDGDSCSDGAEVNQFMTNPLVADCKQEEKLTGEVIITDPQAGWVVSTLKISGTTPMATTAVDVVALPAEDKILKNLIDELTTVITTNSTKFDALTATLQEAKDFVASYKEAYDYADLESAVKKMDNVLGSVKSKLELGQKIEMRNLASNLTELQGLARVSIYLGKSLPAAETDTMDLGTLRFKLEPVDVKLASEKLYDLVATATLTDGQKISSIPVRVNVNRDVTVKKPIPRYIGSKKIPGELVTGVAVDNATYVNNKLQVEVTEDRPMISGDCEFGSQVFAVWESIVLSSSVISDSEEGTFSIQPPKNLEPNTNHKVTLYAIKDMDGKKVRSENTEIYFRINKAEAGGGYTGIILLGLFLLLLLIVLLVLRHKLKERKMEKVVKELMKKQRDNPEGAPLGRSNEITK
jgi:cysteine-rich repeat protein